MAGIFLKARNDVDRLRIAHESVDNPESSAQLLHSIFSWCTKTNKSLSYVHILAFFPIVVLIFIIQGISNTGTCIIKLFLYPVYRLSQVLTLCWCNHLLHFSKK